MNPSRHFLLAALLALTAGCRTTPVDRDRLIYAPHEEGLTLAYENPSLGSNARMDSHLQVRVEAAQPVSGGGVINGELRHTRLNGEVRYTFEIKNGGVKVTDEQKHASVLLPEGFPEQVHTWGVDGGDRSRVLGRATSPMFDKLLPKDAPKVGIWIESFPEKGEGPRTRTFLLPDVGIAEVLEWQAGRWSPTLRLVGRGFTDVKPKTLTLPAVIRGAKT